MAKVYIHTYCLCAQFYISAYSITLKWHAKLFVWEQAHKFGQFRLKKCNYLATSRFFEYGDNKSPSLFMTQPERCRLRAEYRLLRGAAG